MGIWKQSENVRNTKEKNQYGFMARREERGNQREKDRSCAPWNPEHESSTWPFVLFLISYLKLKEEKKKTRPRGEKEENGMIEGNSLIIFNHSNLDKGALSEAFTWLTGKSEKANIKLKVEA